MPIVIPTVTGGALYLNLVSMVKDWAARFDTKFTGRVDDMIALAEARIWDRVRLSPGLSQPITLTVPGGVNYVPLPADFLQASRVWNPATTGSKNQIEYRPIDDLPNGQSNTDDRHYSVVGLTFYWGTTPGTSTDLLMTYYQRPPAAINATEPENWLLRLYPNIYLYGALLEAAIFTKNQERIAEFGSLFDKAVTSAEASDAALRFPKDQRLVIRPVGGVV